MGRVDESLTFPDESFSLSSGGLNIGVWSVWSVRKLSSFCFPAFYWGGNEQELFHGNTVRISGNERN